MDTRTERKEREEVIVKSLRELAKIHDVEQWRYDIETWSCDDTNPVINGTSGIRITMTWKDENGQKS